MAQLRTSLSPLNSERSELGKVCSKIATWALAACMTANAVAACPSEQVVPSGGSFAIRCAKALVCELEGRQTMDHALLLVSDGRIVAIGDVDELELPEGCEVFDAGSSWLMPGMIDLHSHVGGPRGYNDMVFQVNPGLRVSATARAGNGRLKRPIAAGITTILYIPGSGTNIGGQGVLMKTLEGTFEEALVRDPGSMKVAQGDNPKRWGYGMQRALMNHHIRYSLRQGKAYAERWEAFEGGETNEAPERHINLDIYRDLNAEKISISTHTQYFQVVLATLRILRMEFGFPTFIDHGSFDSWRLGKVAKKIGVPAILGPREVMWPTSSSRFPAAQDGAAQGCAAGFQEQGVELIGFNTDAPVIPQEELPLQSAMGVRYGMDNSAMAAVRGLTIVPAVVCGQGDELGSLEAGKQADLVILDGDPSDPRTSIRYVWIAGKLAYDAEEQEVRGW
ncbi:MAG: imidazolonepropionase-like amidohydrolase [Candidatus Paceibacteria bacterium]|jgi:imidazolonepropionase-like amidohydrolase